MVPKTSIPISSDLNVGERHIPLKTIQGPLFEILLVLARMNTLSNQNRCMKSSVIIIDQIPKLTNQFTIKQNGGTSSKLTRGFRRKSTNDSRQEKVD